MKIKLIVSLIALCLSLSIVSVQAQTDTVGAMDNVNVFMTGDIAKTITCNVTGNAVMFEEMENMTEDNNITENMTTFNVTGRILLIKDIGNMTEKAVMIGKMDNMPGNVVIFGEKEKITEGMENVDNVTEYMNKMTVLMTGNMTGTITFDTTEGMDNVTEKMNKTVGFVTGNMTGTVTGDMTRKMVIIKNMGPIAEMVKKVCNTTWTTDGTDYIPGPAECNMTGKMVIIKTMDNMTGTDEDMDDLLEMDGNRAILEKMDNITGMDESMDNVTGKVIIVQKMDDGIKIVTKPIALNTTESTTMIENMD